MDNKLILKIKFNAKNKMIFQTEREQLKVYHGEDVNSILNNALILLDFDDVAAELENKQIKLNSLYKLIESGFTIRIDEIKDDHLRFMAFKGNASMAFEVSKEQGISKVLIDAEEWATEMLEELNAGKNM